jgi:hypothetical protein
VKRFLSIFLLVAAIGAFTYTLTFAEDAPKGPVYVGDNANKCKMCHPNQIKAFENSGMFHKAWGVLDAEAQKKDECIKCHVTGYGAEGGWVSFEKTPLLVNVQCEACHGPASDHIKSPAKVKPAGDPKANCTTCHDDAVLKPMMGDKFKPFNLEESLKAIKHWKDAEAAS